jgi:hypothetical protein
MYKDVTHKVKIIDKIQKWHSKHEMIIIPTDYDAGSKMRRMGYIA